MTIALRRVLATALLIVATAGAGAVASAAPASASTTSSYMAIVKFKSNWGGGWVLNTGQTEGVLVSGWPAQLWYNRPADWNNRWVKQGGEATGWWLYLNLYSKKCLAAISLAEGSSVVQKDCNINDTGQLWRFDGALGYLNGHMPVRNKGMDYSFSSPPKVLTQQSQALGSLIVMKAWSGATTQYWRSAPCGYADPKPYTPSEC